MDVSDGSQDLLIGYWTLPVVGPEDCAETDWDAAKSTEGWTCTINGVEYEYADFHVMTANEDPCPKATKPTGDLPAENVAFCQ